MPVGHARGTWGRALRAADPQLARRDALRTDWMTGAMFYLRTPSPVVHGHINCLDSPWSVTGVGQARFWDGRDFSRDYGDGQAHDCLPAIISEWDKPGILYGKTAKVGVPAVGGVPRTRSSPSSGASRRTASTTPAGRPSRKTTVSAGSWTRR